MLTHKILIFFFFIGLVGTVLFYPLKMESGNTCLFDRLIDKNVTTIAISQHIPDEKMNHLILKKYLVPFGLAWWLSIGLVVLTFYQLRNFKNKSKESICKPESC